MAEQLELPLGHAPVVVDVYVYGDRDSMWDKASEIGLTGAAAEHFSYTAYELKLTYEVDRSTGKSRLLAVDGQPLK